MTIPNSQMNAELPSSGKLLRSTAIAAAVALLLLVTVVMPAEYGVDPTGIGRVLGLTEMGEIKAQLAREVEADAAADLAAAAATPGVPGSSETAAPGTPATTQASAATGPMIASDTVEVVLAPNEGKEIKLAMRQGAQVNYRWAAGRGVVNYDTHADREAAPAIKYHGYGKGQGKQSDEGVLTAAFDGMHGWFWRNRGTEAVTVTLHTSGDYSELKKMY